MFLMKDNKITPAQVKVSSSPSYTLAELQSLMKEWLQIPNGPVDYSPALTLSTFLVWMEKKEQANEAKP